MKQNLYVLTALVLVTCKSAQQVCINQARINKEALCTMQFDPVCGCDGKTYSNACFAESAGLTSFTKGTCPE